MLWKQRKEKENIFDKGKNENKYNKNSIIKKEEKDEKDENEVNKEEKKDIEIQEKEEKIHHQNNYSTDTQKNERTSNSF